MDSDRQALVVSVADAFFDATGRGEWDTAAALVAPDAVVWQNVDGVERRFHDCIPRYRKMTQVLGVWTYDEVRRIVGDNGFCEQHVVAFAPPNGTPNRVPVCAVVTVDDAGLISRLDEYMDSAAT